MGNVIRLRNVSHINEEGKCINSHQRVDDKNAHGVQIMKSVLQKKKEKKKIVCCVLNTLKSINLY